MARILSELVVKKIGDRRWELVTPFEYHVGDANSGDIISVPIGTKTDFASVPQAFWWLFPPDGRYTGAAVLHDYLYQKWGWVPDEREKPRSRKECDGIFLEAMEVLGVNWWRRHIMYRSVRTFGWVGFNRNKKKGGVK